MIGQIMALSPVGAEVDVLRERRDQVVRHGHAREADDALPDGHLVWMARGQLEICARAERGDLVILTKADIRRRLVRAAALVIAEIERLDRAVAPR